MSTQHTYNEEESTASLVANSDFFSVILFNDDFHSFDEVTTQLIKAIRCDYDKANSLTYLVHSKGSANVFEGELNKCIRVSSVLEEIDLQTEIRTSVAY